MSDKDPIYDKPELFVPPIEDQKRVAKELAKSFSPDKALRLTDGTVVQGTADRPIDSK